MTTHIQAIIPSLGADARIPDHTHGEPHGLKTTRLIVVQLSDTGALDIVQFTYGCDVDPDEMAITVKKVVAGGEANWTRSKLERFVIGCGCPTRIYVYIDIADWHLAGAAGDAITMKVPISNYYYAYQTIPVDGHADKLCSFCNNRTEKGRIHQFNLKVLVKSGEGVLPVIIDPIVDNEGAADPT
ncbi:MAG: hypothetical protein ACFB22_07315 [Rhodothalassiaceae bacterium]